MSDAVLALMRRIDEMHLNCLFAGARMLRDLLRLEGIAVGRLPMSTLMEKMGVGRATASAIPACPAAADSP